MQQEFAVAAHEGVQMSGNHTMDAAFDVNFSPMAQRPPDARTDGTKLSHQRR